jgi:hypothetical protein
MLSETKKKSGSSRKEKQNVKNAYRWLLRREDAKAKARGPDSDQLKAQAIVK